MAGESAEQVARRQRERAGRLVRSAEMWERGAAGERATEAILDELRVDGWTTFHDVRWPGRVRANLDHVAVGPAGIFVIDSKNWSGRIEVREDAFWCHGRRQDKAVAAAREAALAVAGVISAPATVTVRSALCFVRDDAVAGWCDDVMLCSTANLREMLLTRPRVLTPDQVRLAALELDLGFQAAAQARVVHPPVSRAPRPPRRRTQPAPARPRRRSKESPVNALLRLLAVTVIAFLAIGNLPRLGEAISDGAAPAEVYGSCKQLRRDYPTGVGTVAAVDGLVQRRLPVMDDRAYEANAELDTDADGIACERR